MSVHFLIDKKRITAADDATILTAARENGIEIPTFCNFADLTANGACRICLVEVTYADGLRQTVTACDTPVREGMQVYTETAAVRNARRISADILLSQCPNLPAVQRLAAALDVTKPGFSLESGKNPCVQCGACVRACKEKSVGILAFHGKGTERAVSTPNGEHNAACDSCTACIRYCPTGAVTRTLGIGVGKPLRRLFSRRLSSRDWFRMFFLSLFVVSMLMTIADVQIQGFPNNLFSLMDPLQGGAALVTGNPAVKAFWPALVILALTLLFGKVWCGWICPTGTILQAFGKRGQRIKRKWPRYLKVILWAFLMLMAAFGFMTYFWFDPIAMLARPFGVAANGDFIASLGLSVSPLLRLVISVGPLLLMLILNVIERGFWCRYLCPLGGMMGLCARISAKKQRVDRESCIECGECAALCPMGAIDGKAPYIADPAECTMCQECGTYCPKYAIYFGRKRKGIITSRYQPDRREFLTTGVASVSLAAAGLAIAGQFPASSGSSTQLFPPGAVRTNAGIVDKETFLLQCTRCGQCIAACPEGILKPSLGQSDWTTLTMPEVNLSESSCRPDCIRCSQACPSGAIPRFTVDDKLAMKIGTAQVNQATCVQCYQCVSACPFNAFEQQLDSASNSIYPVVNPERCNGCGMCFSVCPARKDGAIVVLPPIAAA